MLPGNLLLQKLRPGHAEVLGNLLLRSFRNHHHLAQSPTLPKRVFQSQQAGVLPRDMDGDEPTVAGFVENVDHPCPVESELLGKLALGQAGFVVIPRHSGCELLNVTLGGGETHELLFAVESGSSMETVCMVGLAGGEGWCTSVPSEPHFRQPTPIAVPTPADSIAGCVKNANGDKLHCSPQRRRDRIPLAPFLT